MKKSTKGFIGGFFLGGILTPIVGYFTYKLVKPDYLKDYEEDDDFDDKKPAKQEDDFDDFDDIDDLDDLDEDTEKQLEEFNERANKWVKERFGPVKENKESVDNEWKETLEKINELSKDIKENEEEFNNKKKELDELIEKI